MTRLHSMPSRDVLELSAEKYQFWIIDHVEKTVSVVPQQGEKVTLPIADLPDIPGIAVSIYDWEKSWISTVTVRGHIVFTMGFNPESKAQGPHRPTIYLDQNKWSLLATSLLSPDRVKNKRELEAALEVHRYASDDGAILPLSSGHLLETSSLHTERRYEVGVTIASLSSGWQMRHPMNIWQQEASALLAQHLGIDDVPGADRPVITTEPRAWLYDTEGHGLGRTPFGDLALFERMLSAAGVMVQQLIDPTPLERSPLDRWVDTHARITHQFSTLPPMTKEQKRALARRRFWNENIGIYRSALQKTFGETDFPMFSDRELRRLLHQGPMTALLSEMFVTRFVDKGNKWHRNDLVDIFFLTAASAHCDYVVAEAKTASQLQQIQRSLNMQPNVHRTFLSLVEQLHADGLTTDTERSASACLGQDNGLE